MICGGRHNGMGEKWEDDLCTEGGSRSCLMVMGIPVLDSYIRGSKISPSAITLKHRSVKLCSRLLLADSILSLDMKTFP